MQIYERKNESNFAQQAQSIKKLQPEIQDKIGKEGTAESSSCSNAVTRGDG
jgi:hypothetical protein